MKFSCQPRIFSPPIFSPRIQYTGLIPCNLVKMLQKQKEIPAMLRFWFCGQYMNRPAERERMALLMV